MRYPSDSSLRPRRRRRLRSFLLLLVVAALAVAAAGAFRVGPAPAIVVRPEPSVIGRATPIEVTVTEPSRGLSRVRIELVQDGRAEPLADQSFAPLPGWKLLGDKTTTWNWPLELGKNARPALREGEATLRVVAERAPGWLRAGEPAVREYVVPVRLTPPQLAVLSSQHYVAQGGSEAIVYRVGPTSVRDGVEVGDWFFPGWPLPGGGEADRFALFAVPYDVADPAQARLVAVDDAGNRRETGFIDQFFPNPPAADDIQLEDKFLARVVPAILSGTPELTP
jgi:hypothetical protein